MPQIKEIGEMDDIRYFRQKIDRMIKYGCPSEAMIRTRRLLELLENAVSTYNRERYLEKRSASGFPLVFD